MGNLLSNLVIIIYSLEEIDHLHLTGGRGGRWNCLSDSYFLDGRLVETACPLRITWFGDITLADDECPPFSKAPESVNHVFFMGDVIRSKLYLLLQGSNSKILNVTDHLTLFYIVFTVHQQLAIQPWFLNFSS